MRVIAILDQQDLQSCQCETVGATFQQQMPGDSRIEHAHVNAGGKDDY